MLEAFLLTPQTIHIALVAYTGHYMVLCIANAFHAGGNELPDPFIRGVCMALTSLAVGTMATCTPLSHVVCKDEKC